MAEGTIGPDEYMTKLGGFVTRRTEEVKRITRPEAIRANFGVFESYYPEKAAKPKKAAAGGKRK